MFCMIGVFGIPGAACAGEPGAAEAAGVPLGGVIVAVNDHATVGMGMDSP